MSEIKDNDESLISHLEALRGALIKCFVSVGILLVPAFYLSPKALNFLIKILISDNKITLNYFAPMEIFILQMKLALLMAFACAFPYILKTLWNFILPALYEHERKFIRNIVISSSCFFILGFTFCVFLILPLIINFGISFSNGGITPLFGAANVVNLALWLGFVFGLMFQVPLIVNLLIKWNILSYKSVSSKRPYVVIALLSISALFTPPDIVSQILLFVPTYMLFEFGLLFSKKGKNV